MFPSSFYWTMLEMGIYTFSFHAIFKNFFHYEKKMFEKYSVNMMRSAMCLYFTLQGIKMIGNVSSDLCLINPINRALFQNVHYPFLSYFVWDTVIMFYQRYLKVEPKIRYDLLFHHGLAITSLMIIEQYDLYGLSVLMTLSEGMSIVSGMKLICNDFGPKALIKPMVWYRFMYIIVVRMMLLWTAMIYYYHRVTSECEEYKNDRNIWLMMGLIGIIYHADIKWMHNARNEMKRI